jgi:hypothetical protein
MRICAQHVSHDLNQSLAAHALVTARQVTRRRAGLWLQHKRHEAGGSNDKRDVSERPDLQLELVVYFHEPKVGVGQ